jgi:hypothetical protein
MKQVTTIGLDIVEIHFSSARGRRGGAVGSAAEIVAKPGVEDTLLDLTNRRDVAIGPFLGSGPTLVAAQRTGRVCRGIELDPLYVDIIIRRYEAASARRLSTARRVLRRPNGALSARSVPRFRFHLPGRGSDRPRYGVEQDPLHADVIVRRLEAATGIRVALVETGERFTDRAARWEGERHEAHPRTLASISSSPRRHGSRR